MHGLKKTAIAICLQSDDPGMFNHLIFHYLLKDLGRGDIHIIRPLRGDPVFNYKLKDIEKGINIGQLDIIIKFKEVDNPLLYVGFLQQVDSLSYADTAIDKLNEYGINTILIPIGLWAEVPFHMPRRFLYLATHEELSEKLKEYSMHPMHGIIRDDFFMDVLYRIKEKGLFGAFIFTLIPHYILPEHDRPIPLFCTNFDLQALYDLAIRMNDIFNININIEYLKDKADKIIKQDWEFIKDIGEKNPEIKIGQYISSITSVYHEEPYPYLNKQWKDAIDSLQI